MSADVVQLDAFRPHVSGAARCLSCSHAWQAVAPIGTTRLECGACGLPQGAFVNPIYPEREAVFICNCGSDLYLLLPSGAMCARCGIRASGWC